MDTLFPFVPPLIIVIMIFYGVIISVMIIVTIITDKRKGSVDQTEGAETQSAVQKDLLITKNPDELTDYTSYKNYNLWPIIDCEKNNDESKQNRQSLKDSKERHLKDTLQEQRRVKDRFDERHVLTISLILSVFAGVFAGLVITGVFADKPIEPKNLGVDSLPIIVGSVLTISLIILTLIYFYPTGSFNPYYPISQLRPYIADPDQLYKNIRPCTGAPVQTYSNQNFKEDLEVYCQYMILLGPTNTVTKAKKKFQIDLEEGNKRS